MTTASFNAKAISGGAVWSTAAISSSRQSRSAWLSASMRSRRDGSGKTARVQSLRLLFDPSGISLGLGNGDGLASFPAEPRRGTLPASRWHGVEDATIYAGNCIWQPVSDTGSAALTPLTIWSTWKRSSGSGPFSTAWPT